MGLEKVKQEILEDARKEAAKITDEANEEAKSVMKSAVKQVQEYEGLMNDDIDSSVEAMRRRELAAAELELQKKVLELKNGLIEAVFSEVRKRLNQLSEKTRGMHIRSLWDLARKEMDAAVVRCNSKDAKFFDEGGGYGKLKVVKNEAILGGIIAESSDGRLSVDYSYETMLEQVKAKVLSDVAGILFGK